MEKYQIIGQTAKIEHMWENRKIQQEAKQLQKHADNMNMGNLSGTTQKNYAWTTKIKTAH